MKAKEVEAIESYFKTENKHWNSYAFKMLCEVLKENEFEDPEQPLKFFSDAISLFENSHETPLKAVETFNDSLEKSKLFGEQKLFIYEWIHKYLCDSEFDINLSEIKSIVKSKKEKLSIETQAKPRVKDIRCTFKEMMQKEIENLPATLEGLEPMQRLTIVSKLIPFVMPKADNINSKNDFDF